MHVTGLHVIKTFTTPRKVLFCPRGWLQESWKSRRGEGAGAHHQTACCSCAGEGGQRAQRARFVGATRCGRGRCNPVRGGQRGDECPCDIQQGLSSKYPRPHITPRLEEAREPREKKWGRGFVLPERRRKPVGTSA